MTEDEALRSLVERAENENLFLGTVSWSTGRIRLRVATDYGIDELVEYRRHFGGLVGKGRKGIDSWAVHDKEAIDVVDKLIVRPDFRKTRRFYYATVLKNLWIEMHPEDRDEDRKYKQT